jgi:hypothetical protein
MLYNNYYHFQDQEEGHRLRIIQYHSMRRGETNATGCIQVYVLNYKPAIHWGLTGTILEIRDVR